jgi:hypothetical protein
MKRGSHPSAQEFHEFVSEEMQDMVERQYWVVLPYKLVRSLPNLRISPLGVVPQRERRPRIIVDYTFSGVNNETDPQAFREAMQFGRALIRIMQAVLFASEEHGPIYLLKVDLSDGFYRVNVDANDIPRLGVALPKLHHHDPFLVAFPLVLPMGWTESPPHFTSATETIVDLANQWAPTWDPPRHPLETLAATPPPPFGDRIVITVPPPLHPSEIRAPVVVPQGRPHRRRNFNRPLLHADVFVDDEVLAAQGSNARLDRIRRVLLHCNDLVFRPNEPTGDEHRREPISVKKLLKGDACWATAKIILGWLLDTLLKTIELPPHRKARLLEILSNVRGKRRLGQQTVYKLLGELRSMVLAIPGGAGLFSQLQLALVRKDGHRVKLHSQARDQLEDFWILANDVAARPTHMSEIIPQPPAFVGACDAAKSGMGGVWLPPDRPSSKTPDHHPIVWRVPFPLHIQKDLVSTNNPTGSITNSDLELAGTIGNADVLVHAVDCRHKTIATMCDNTPAVSWQGKGSVTTAGAASYLLREASLHQRQHRYLQVTSHIPGDRNTMADIASRRFDLSDSQLLHLFDTRFPQTRTWQLHHLKPAMLSQLICALQRQRPNRPSLAAVPSPTMRPGSKSGSHFAPASTFKIPCWNKSATKFPSSKSSPPASVMVEPLAAVNRFEVSQWQTKYWPYRRRSPSWGPLIPGSTLTARSTPVSPTYGRA